MTEAQTREAVEYGAYCWLFGVALNEIYLEEKQYTPEMVALAEATIAKLEDSC